MNYGVIPFKTLPTMYRAGGETGIVFEERMLKGDWRKHRPTPEDQFGYKIDTMGCTHFSALNSVEEQIDYLIATGKLFGDDLKILHDLGLFDEKGKFNGSDRFSNFIGGTTKQGNYMYNPWETFRLFGILPESDFIFNKSFTWEEYYVEPGQARRDKAKKILDVLDFKWEVVHNGELRMTDDLRENMEHHLHQAPLHVATPVCPTWSNLGVVQKCGLTNTQHATVIDCIDELDKFFYDFDSYGPYGKQLAKDYCIPCVIKGVVTVKEKPVIKPVEKFKHYFSHKIGVGEKCDEVKAVQKALKILGFFPFKVVETGFYGEITRVAVDKFYKAYKLDNALVLKYIDGRWVGPKMRDTLNKIFNK